MALENWHSKITGIVSVPSCHAKKKYPSDSICVSIRLTRFTWHAFHNTNYLLSTTTTFCREFERRGFVYAISCVFMSFKTMLPAFTKLGSSLKKIFFVTKTSDQDTRDTCAHLHGCVHSFEEVVESPRACSAIKDFKTTLACLCIK